jgi:hypothetical protein
MKGTISTIPRCRGFAGDILRDPDCRERLGEVPVALDAW